MKILITSGGCKVPIDDVRHIGNFSSGRYGVELAKAFIDADYDNEIIFFHEKGSARIDEYWTDTFDPNNQMKYFEYKNYKEYLGVKNLITLYDPDIIVSAAAISDYVLDQVEGKISSDANELVITLKKGEKVIKSFRGLAPAATIVGFKLLVSPDECDLNEAIAKAFKSRVDMVVYNDLTDLRNGEYARTVYQLGKHVAIFYPTVYQTAREVVDCILTHHASK